MRNRWAVLAGAATIAVLAVASWRLAGLGLEPSGTAPAPAGTAADPAGADTATGTAPVPAGAAETVSPAATSTPRGTAPGTAASPADATASPADGTVAPAEVAPPTPSPADPPAGGAPLRGSARRADPAGDLADTAGQPPPEPQPAADLTEVALSGDGDELVVEFTLAGDVPARAGSLVWSLDVWLGEDLAYTVTAQLVGARLVAGVLDWDSGEQVPPPEPPAASGRTVVLRVPRDLLARVDGPFQWQALAQADGGYEDYVPADGVLAWFPDPGA